MKRTMVVLVMAVALLTMLGPTVAPRVQAATANCPNGAGWTPSSSVIGIQVECRLGTTPASLGYLQYLPTGYQTGTSYPLIVFFHGQGKVGNGTTQLANVATEALPELIKNGKTFNAIVISPQTATSWPASVTTAFVNYLLSYYKVDQSRIYITGLSLGGLGTWEYAKANRNLVAAIVPICGGGSSTAGYEVLRGLPTWAFHNDVDSVVPISTTINRLKVITGVDPQPIQPGSTAYFNAGWTWRAGELKPQANENPAFTVYRKTAHDAWTATYNNQQMWDWLFAQGRQTNVVFQQDFESSTSVASYVNSSSPGTGQFNDITAEANGGAWTINQGRLQLQRTGISSTDNGAGITRYTDFAGPPSVLHLTFDVGVSGWTTSPYQSNALSVSIGRYTGLIDYNSGGVVADVFQNVTISGNGPGSFTVATGGVESAALAADGGLHRVALFLNKTATATEYRAPDGTLKPLRANGAALWVDGAAVVLDGVAMNGSSSSLSDLRLRWASQDNGSWLIDNVVVRSALK